MSEILHIDVNKEILEWAIEESGKDSIEIHLRFDMLKNWLDGTKQPTVKQLESFAKYLKVPFGYMFLEKPPKDDVYHAEFRTINNEVPIASKNLRDLLVLMQRKKEWLSEYRYNNGWEKLSIVSSFKRASAFSKGLVDDVKDELGLSNHWYKDAKNYDEAFHLLREALEQAGIIVMQSGIVGFDTHRKLDIKEFRAFALYDDFAPLIFINTNDSIQGKIFSLIHEFFHILFEAEDIVVELNSIKDKKRLERKINKLTEEFLMPEDVVRNEWSNLIISEDEKKISALASLFKVSLIAMAIRLNHLGYIDDHMVKTISSFYRSSKNKNSGGGDFYRNYWSRTSRAFASAVVHEVETGNLSYTYAFDLLGGLNRSNYDKIKETLSYE